MEPNEVFEESWCVGRGECYGGRNIETDLNVRELNTHYQKQLLEAGWVLKEDVMSSSFAWS